jgi:type I restriction enzyme M protein
MMADHFVDVNKMIYPKPGNSVREYERIPLGADIDQYCQREVKPHLPNSWMARSKDKTGYEINFTKYLYKYKPLRSVEEITKDMLDQKKEDEGTYQEMSSLIWSVADDVLRGQSCSPK